MGDTRGYLLHRAAPRIAVFTPMRPAQFNFRLGLGAFKAVFKAYDEEEGIEVAWCQVSMDRVGEQEKAQIHKEVEILKSLSHKNILTFFAYFDIPDTNQLVFVTEIMTSGTLKQCAPRQERGWRGGCHTNSARGQVHPEG